jgi:hypothetical protein
MIATVALPAAPEEISCQIRVRAKVMASSYPPGVLLEQPGRMTPVRSKIAMIRSEMDRESTDIDMASF